MYLINFRHDCMWSGKCSKCSDVRNVQNNIKTHLQNDINNDHTYSFSSNSILHWKPIKSHSIGLEEEQIELEEEQIGLEEEQIELEEEQIKLEEEQIGLEEEQGLEEERLRLEEERLRSEEEQLIRSSLRLKFKRSKKLKELIEISRFPSKTFRQKHNELERQRRRDD